ncbi:hypothetical protein MRX96_002391 [Rhipicephalus microplus]|uniref:TRAF1-6 MATH domain-containing protein n=1 Tax=Rhipicephalus microplus TaxID=6941 RepID=A0A9J6EA42_RHIMP|nr:hypothetical protein HPB51_017175 [Rhipicephalus microplus]
MGSSGSKEEPKNHPLGPVRHASKSGVFIQLLEFPGMYGYRDARLKSSKDTYSQALKCTLGGYTFAIQCRFLLDNDGDVTVAVVVFLQAGEWDNNVEWPFAKKVWVGITHPRDHEKDIWHRVYLTKPESTKRPEASRWNFGSYNREVKFRQLQHNGFIHDGKLYVNIELH